MASARNIAVNNDIILNVLAGTGDRRYDDLYGVITQARIDSLEYIIDQLIERRLNFNQERYRAKPPFFAAIRRGDQNIIRKLLPLNAFLEDADGNGPFHFCTDEHVIRLLVDAGYNINKRNNKGISALLLNIDRMSDSCVRTMLDLGANPNLASVADDYVSNISPGTTPLMRANSEDKTEQLLLARAEINDTDRYGKSALFRAIEYGNEDVVDVLLEHGASVDLPDERDVTPLMRATELDHVEIIELLLQHGAEVNVQDRDMRTALDRVNSDAAYRLLMRAGAEILDDY